MKDRSPCPSTDDDDDDEEEEEEGGEVVSDDDSSCTDGGDEEDYGSEGDGDEGRGDVKSVEFAPDDEDGDGSRKSQNVAALVRFFF